MLELLGQAMLREGQSLLDRILADDASIPSDRSRLRGGPTMSRSDDTDRFYSLLAALTARTGGPRELRLCTGRSGWPSHGVYFFFEAGETRCEGETPRCTRIGTHALRAASKATLWTRLAQHRGIVGRRNPGAGNHRGSIFRRHVGAALMTSQSYRAEIVNGWLAPSRLEELRVLEAHVERAVSDYIGRMPFLWLSVPSRPDGGSDRGFIEANAIALLSMRTGGIDPASPTWLGNVAASEKVQTSGLWNVNHVDDSYDPSFLDLFEAYVIAMP